MFDLLCIIIVDCLICGNCFMLFIWLDARFVENKREAREFAEKEGRKLKAQDYLYQVQ